ncbi:MAG: hypothetical protein IH865_10320 [Chloroflexi bacterium]|nr:hypothetical protein [Chloroflexota bacterium]
MSTQNEVKENWRERRDLVLAVRQRVSDQLLKLNDAIAPEAGPDAEELLRIEALQFELGQLEEAFDDAERKYLTHSLGSDETKGEEDNG